MHILYGKGITEETCVFSGTHVQTRCWGCIPLSICCLILLPMSTSSSPHYVISSVSCFNLFSDGGTLYSSCVAMWLPALLRYSFKVRTQNGEQVRRGSPKRPNTSKQDEMKTCLWKVLSATKRFDQSQKLALFYSSLLSSVQLCMSASPQAQVTRGVGYAKLYISLHFVDMGL